VKHDILAELHLGTLSLADAEEFYESVMESEDAHNAQESLGLSRAEWTAFGQGVPFEELAHWRYDGWPTACARCKGNLDLDSSGWFALESGNEHTLVHVTCPPGASRT